jgi:hypothetical protein
MGPRGINIKNTCISNALGWDTETDIGWVSHRLNLVKKAKNVFLFRILKIIDIQPFSLAYSKM